MTADRSPIWHVLGSGAMACLWSARLLASGHAVRMIRRNPPRREEYHALRLETAAGAIEQRVLLEASGADLPIERLLVCTKAQDVVAALRALAPRLAPGARVVLLQNGAGYHDEAARLVPAGALFCALSTEGAFLEAPLHARHAGIGHTLLGAWPNAERTAAAGLARELGASGLDVRALADTVPALWRKLAINCAINPLAAARGVTNGTLLDDPALHAEFDLLCTEIAAILAALGHAELAQTLAREAAGVARATAANRCSMLQDLAAGRATEIEFITGYLCRSAHRAGIPSPLNDALYTRVRALERLA